MIILSYEEKITLMCSLNWDYLDKYEDMLAEIEGRLEPSGGRSTGAYYHHRYSDDLYFFVNQSQNYDEQLDEIFAFFQKDGFVWDSNSYYNDERKKNETFRHKNIKNGTAYFKAIYIKRR